MTKAAAESYWDDYSPLQEVKHRLIRRYLGGWFPILARRAERVLYIDTHAGRGKHLSGALGSPLVALRTLLDHKARSSFAGCEFQFHLIEQDEENFVHLVREVESLPPLPANIKVIPHCGDAFARVREFLTVLKSARQQIAPAFVFVDPFGFKIPASLLRELMKAGQVELFVNVMWRQIGMALSQKDVPPGMAARLAQLFDGDEWRAELRTGEDFDARADRAIDLLSRKVGARWSTPIRMLGDNGVTKYFLVHFTNHDLGRDLMKDAIWSVCGDGGFYARQSDDPNQQFLIPPTPDLQPLREWMLATLGGCPRRWKELHELARPTLWMEKHVNSVVNELIKAGTVIPSGSNGKVAASKDPLLTLR